MSSITTRSRTFQYLGLFLVFGLVALSYWYFSARAGVNPNSSSSQPQGSGRLDAGLTGYWKLDEGSGTSAADSSTNAITALTLTNTASTWTTGQINGAFDFDGTDDYATTADNDVLDFADSTNFTLTGWFNRDTFTTDDTIMAKSNGQAGTDTGYNVYIDDATDKVTAVANDGTDQYKLESTTTFTATGWHHFALVWNDTASSQTKLYIDGADNSATATGTFGNVNSLANALAFRLAAESDNGNPFDGKLDEMRVYSRALSADEIADLYRLTTPTGVDTSLKGYWSFNGQDVVGTVAYDNSGVKNVGTITGPVKAAGISNQALNFDGVNDYVDLGTSTTLKPSNFTFAIWTYADTGDAVTYRHIFNPSYSDSGWDTGWSLCQADESTTSGPYLVRWGDGTNPSAGTIYSVTNMVGGWHQAVVTFNGTTISLYVDGKLESSANASTLAYSGAAQNSFLGGGGAGGLGLNYFDGRLDEPRLYNRVLSTSEIKALYDQGNPEKTNSSASQPQGAGRLDSGLIGYWALDESTGSTASDSSNGGNNATLVNMENGDWVAGQIKNSLSFDGVNEYATTSRSVPSRGSLSVWVKGTMNISTSADWYALAASASGNYLTLRVSTYTSFNNFCFAMRGAFGTDVTDVCSPSYTDSPTLQLWHHLVAVWDATQGAKLYVDGGLAAQTTTTTSNFDAMTLDIGKLGAEYWAGQLDEIRMYNRMLTSDEVGDLYRLSAPTSVETGLKGYWSFNGQNVVGTTTYDLSGAGNTGTLTNGPTVAVGKIGQALSFDGSNDNVTIADTSTYTGSALTVSFWKKDTNALQNRSLVTKSSSGQRSWSLEGDDVSTGVGDSAVRFYTATGVNETSTYGTTPVLMSSGQWYHIVGVYNGAGSGNSGRMQIYVNGVAQPLTFTGTVPASLTDNTTGTLIGQGGIGTTNFLGSMDEVRVYNRALSADEVKALYLQGR